MATKNTTKDLASFIAALRDLCDEFLDDSPADEAQTQTRAPKGRGKASAKVTADEPESDEDDDDDDADGEADVSVIPDEAALKKLAISKLRTLAKEFFEDDEVDGASKTDLIESLLELAADEDGDDADDEDDDDDADADADADDEDADDTDDEFRAELEAMKIAELRKLARDEYGAEPGDLKGVDKDGIIDLILDSESEDDSDVDVSDDADEEDGYTEDELDAMELDELKEIADEWDVEYTARVRKPKLIAALLEAQEEGDDEE